MAGPAVNRIEYSHTSVNVDVDAIRRAGFTAINYSDNVERGEIRSNGSQQVEARTEGDYKAEADVEMLRSKFDAMVADLGDGFYDQEFNVTVHRKLLASSPVMTDTLVRCRFKGRNFESKPGTDGHVVKIPLDVDGLLINGRKPYASFKL